MTECLGRKTYRRNTSISDFYFLHDGVSRIIVAYVHVHNTVSKTRLSLRVLKSAMNFNFHSEMIETMAFWKNWRKIECQ